MTGEERERLEQSQRTNCHRKVKHDTIASAFKAIEDTHRNGLIYEGAKLGIYICAGCKKFHWGHRGGVGHLRRQRKHAEYIEARRELMTALDEERTNRRAHSSAERRAKLIAAYEAAGVRLPPWLCSEN